MHRRRLQRTRCAFWTINLAGLTTAAAACTYFWMHADRWSHRALAASPDFWLSFTFEYFMFFWAFFVGSVIASFLNVVAYRLPLGLTIHGTSACPFCCTPIAMRDNVPVVGWLMLGGRCRSCRLPISSRYPINEAIGGLSTLSIYIATIMGHGWNLPRHFEKQSPFGISINIERLDPDLIFLAILQCSVVLFLFAAYLLAANKGRMPIVAWLVSIFLLLALFLVRPDLFVDLFDSGSSRGLSLSPTTSIQVLISMLCGMMLGGIIGWRSNRMDLDPAGRQSIGLNDWFLGWVLVGVAFGWQAVACLAFL